MREAIARGDPVTATELDMEWHTVLIDAAHNQYLSRTWRTMGLSYLVWSPERGLYPLAPEKWSVVFESRHQDLLSDLRSRDPGRCGAAVRSHILKKLTDLDDNPG